MRADFFFTGSFLHAARHIIAKGEEDEANGVVSVMTPEFQCEILRCSAELGKFSIVELFAYIKKYVDVGGV